MTFADPTALLIAYLEPLMGGMQVHARVPDPRPEQWLQVRRVGGTSPGVVRDGCRMDVFAWDSEDEARAMATLLTARGLIWALAGNNLLGVTCYRVQESLSPRHLDDPASGCFRAWMTVLLALRANQIIHYSPPPEDES